MIERGEEIFQQCDKQGIAILGSPPLKLSYKTMLFMSKTKLIHLFAMRIWLTE